MSYVVLDGDLAIYQAAFGAALVAVRPGRLEASGPATFAGQKMCVLGDEASARVSGCMYTTASHPIAGSGTLEISALADDQRAQKTRSGGRALLLVGGAFTARFTVQQPAQQPAPPGPPLPDPVPTYAGAGRFVSQNSKWREG